METRTTRLPADLLETAETEGRREHRSAAEQVEHWARFGMYFERQASTTRRRILRAVSGDAALSELDDDERIVANALLDAWISVAANETSFADALAARGLATVVLDERGRMVRRSPDGTSTLI